MRPLRAVCLRWVLRLAVSGHTVLRVLLPRPLAADNDLPRSLVHDRPLSKDQRLDVRPLRLLQSVWSSPGALAASRARGLRSLRGGWGDAAAAWGGGKGLYFAYP